MKAHIELGCESSFTCAPYQLKHRPRLGDQIAWAESNAIVFANSVLGARTTRYGDFLDLAAAITGRAPYAGLHVTGNRAARIVFEAPDVSAMHGRDIWFAALGFLVGKEAGTIVPVITGLPGDTTEDELKARGAAAPSSGTVALSQAVGIPPEETTLDAALQGAAPGRSARVVMEDLRAVRRLVNSGNAGDALIAVALGTPHFSVAEFMALHRLP